MRIALVFALACTSACARPVSPAPSALAVPSDDEARAFVERFFTSYAAGDVEAALSFLCEQDAPSRNLHRAFLERSTRGGSPFHATRFSVRAVEPAWHLAEPYFHVTVAFPRSAEPGEIFHDYRVRAREGCLEQLLGALPPRHGARSSEGEAPKSPHSPTPPEEGRPSEQGPFEGPVAEELIEL